MGGFDDINRINSGNNLDPTNKLNPTNKLDPINDLDTRKNLDLTNKSSSINSVIKWLEDLHQEKDTWLKKLKKDEYLKQYEKELQGLFKTPEWEQLIAKARRNYNSKDPQKKSESAYILQLYAKYKLQDKSVSIDGLQGKQTLTALRYVQSEGVGWERVAWVSITQEQQAKIDAYKKLSEQFSKEDDSTPIDTNSNITQTVESASHQSNSYVNVLSTNTTIQWKMEEINKQTVNVDRLYWIDLASFLTDEEKNTIIHKTINTTISNPQNQEKYFDYIQSGRKDLQMWIDPKSLENIQGKIGEIIKIQWEKQKEAVSKYCKKEAYMTCLSWFEALLNNFDSDPTQIQQWKKDLQSVDPASVNFSAWKLDMNIGYGERKLQFSYDVTTWSIKATWLIDKDPSTWNISTQKQIPREIVSTIQPLATVEQNIENTILSNDPSILADTNNLIDPISGVKSDFIWSMKRHQPTISKSVESHYISKNLMDWIGKIAPDTYRADLSSQKKNNLYKIYDIWYSSIASYTPDQLQKFKSKLPDLQDIVKNYQEGNKGQDSWSQFLSNDKIWSGLTSDNQQDSWLYLLFKNMTHDTAWSNIINITTMEKMIQHDHATDTEWFGNLRHNVLAEIDTTTASHEADKLLESAYS